MRTVNDAWGFVNCCLSWVRGTDGRVCLARRRRPEEGKEARGRERGGGAMPRGGGSVERAVDQAVEAEHVALAGEGHQLHLAAVAGLEADGGAGRDVEP